MLQSAAGTSRNQPALYEPFVNQVQGVVNAANRKLEILERAALAPVERDVDRLKTEARKWAKSVCTPESLQKVHCAARALVFARLAALSIHISQVHFEEKISWPVSAASMSARITVTDHGTLTDVHNF